MRLVMFVLTAILLPVAMIVTAFKYAMDTVDKSVSGLR